MHVKNPTYIYLPHVCQEPEGKKIKEGKKNQCAVEGLLLGTVTGTQWSAALGMLSDMSVKNLRKYMHVRYVVNLSNIYEEKQIINEKKNMHVRR